MARQKQKHFDEMKTWDHVFEPSAISGDKVNLKGTWGQKVILELACGGGDYTIALAKSLPGNTVVGVDIKGARMWIGAKLAKDLGLTNAKFLRTRIESLANYFADGEVDEIWITFPNPHPTLGNEKRRLTSPRFLEMYKKILKSGGKIHLKTDSKELFEYSLKAMEARGLKIVEVNRDVYCDGGADFCDGKVDLLCGIQTCYEKKYLNAGKAISYVQVEKIG